MEKSRLNAYLNLIQTLLTCPHGEEWTYLKQHEDLISAEFLQFMEQLAIQIGREGDHSSATFLHTWAAKLHHILIKEIKPSEPEEDRSQAYLDLIEQLLTCPEGREEQLLIAHETLIGPGLVHAMRDVSKQLQWQGETESAQYLESMATDLSQAWLQEHELPSLLQKPSVPLATRAPAPYSQSYSVTPVASEPVASADVPTPFEAHLPQPVVSAAQAVAPSRSEIDDPWLSSGETDALPVTEPVTVPASIPYPFNPSMAQAEPIHPHKDDRFEQPSPDYFPTPVAQTVAEAFPIETALPTAQAGQQAIAEGLQAIAQALNQLNHTLNTQQTPHLLHRLETLEKAAHANWQLTTEEIEQLLGVRPKCHGHDTVYRRGEWCFTKVGKLGTQTAWRVTKEQDS